MFRCVSVVACGLWLLLGATHGHAGGTQGPWLRGIYTGTSPRPQPTTEERAWQNASTLAECTPGGFVVMGSGRSMQPLYPSDTILVLRPLAYSELQRGQTVLYRNRKGKVVAHVLVAKVRDGWRAQGINNPTHDMEPVLADNLVGVVMAAFMPTARSAPTRFASLH